ncbi:MAG: sugar ABC transporter permease, partial [Clostridia bacterium]|nr:sugar ABC transporter permease [Clostridia bacterium]
LKMDLMEKRNLAGYVFILPFVLGFLLIFLPSIVQSFRFSLSEIVIRADGTGYDLIHKGFTHYYDAFFTDVDFRVKLVETLRDIVINLPVILIFSFFMALLLNRKQFPGRTVFRIIFFLPVIIYTGIASAAGITSGGSGEVAEAAAQVFADPTLGNEGMQSGVTSIIGMAMNIQVIIQSLGLGQTLMDFIMLSISRLEWIIQSSGVQILVFLAALQGVPTSIFEAASVEGLTSWEMFWKITLPMISPQILVNTIYTVVDSFTNNRYEVLSYIQKVSFSNANYGFGSALSFIYFLCTLILIGLVTVMISRFVFYNE